MKRFSFFIWSFDQYSIKTGKLLQSISSHSQSQSNLGQEEGGEDAGDEVDAVVVKNHLSWDWNNSLPGHLHNLSTLQILARKLETENIRVKIKETCF